MTNTFNDIAKRYDSIKPLVSQHHPKEQNLRPIGPRRTKWERIERINKNTFCLWCGYTDGDEIFPGRAATIEYTDKEKIMCAPIVWQRKRGRMDRIKVRGPVYTHATGYLQFLKHYLPEGLELKIRNGTHYIVPTTGKFKGKAYLLQRPTLITAKYEKTKSSYWLKRSGISSEGEDHHLEFDAQPDGTFHPVGKTKKALLRVAKRVDLERKARLTPDIDALWDWFSAVAPLQQLGDGDLYHAKMDALSAYESAHGCYPYSHRVSDEEAEKVIAQDNQEGRMAMLHLLMDNIVERKRVSVNPLRYAYVWPDHKVIRRKFNAYMNNYLGLTRKEVVNDNE